MIISGVDSEKEVGKGLRNVGLWQEGNGVEFFEDLNGALEFCENELLKALYWQRDVQAEPSHDSRFLGQKDSSCTLINLLTPPRYPQRRRSTTNTTNTTITTHNHNATKLAPPTHPPTSRNNHAQRQPLAPQMAHIQTTTPSPPTNLPRHDGQKRRLLVQSNPLPRAQRIPPRLSPLLPRRKHKYISTSSLP